jgi:hypothetical protein
MITFSPSSPFQFKIMFFFYCLSILFFKKYTFFGGEGKAAPQPVVSMSDLSASPAEPTGTIHLIRPSHQVRRPRPEIKSRQIMIMTRFAHGAKHTVRRDADAPRRRVRRAPRSLWLMKLGSKFCRSSFVASQVLASYRRFERDEARLGNGRCRLPGRRNQGRKST